MRADKAVNYRERSGASSQRGACDCPDLSGLGSTIISSLRRSAQPGGQNRQVISEREEMGAGPIPVRYRYRLQAGPGRRPSLGGQQLVVRERRQSGSDTRTGLTRSSDARSPGGGGGIGHPSPRHSPRQTGATGQRAAAACVDRGGESAAAAARLQFRRAVSPRASCVVSRRVSRRSAAAPACATRACVRPRADPPRPVPRVAIASICRVTDCVLSSAVVVQRRCRVMCKRTGGIRTPDGIWCPG